MVMESVKLEPSTIYTVTNLNTIQDKEERDSTVSGYVMQQLIILSKKFKTDASRVYNNSEKASPQLFRKVYVFG